MAEKVQGLFGGMKKGHHEDTGHTPESSPYGTQAADNEYTSQPLDPTGDDAIDEGVPHPQGVTNEQGGAALTDENGNLKPGPHQDAVKREGIFSKIKDKLHGSK